MDDFQMIEGSLPKDRDLSGLYGLVGAKWLYESYYGYCKF